MPVPRLVSRLLEHQGNVIILEEAESRGSGFGFLEFAKVGFLVTMPGVLSLFFLLSIL